MSSSTLRSQTTGPETIVAPKREWHALSASEVFAQIQSTPQGLTQADVAARTEQYGLNTFTEARGDTIFTRLYTQLKSPLTVVLILAFMITLALHEYVDAAVIFCALAIAVAVGLLQEGKASRAFEKLSKSQVHIATVIRGGKKHEIEASQLVPGDVVVLQSGMQVPADIRIFESKKLSINEASLTGEWLAVDKTVEAIAVGTPFAEQASMGWLGTYVAEGYGSGVVVATGDTTAMGALAHELGAIVEEDTSIKEEMARISRIMLGIVAALILIIFIIGLVYGEPLETMLLTAIAIAVASIPEGLPAAVTIILAVGMEALLKRGGLVRNLLAAETLGSTTYILTDKTGTLTQARMAITDAVYIGCLTHDSENVCAWERDDRAVELFDVALCASDAFLDEQTDDHGAALVRGEPMERAILESARGVGLILEGDSLRGRRIDFLAFDSHNRFAAGLAKQGEFNRMCVNGAPEYLLAAASHVCTSTGVVPMDDETRAYFTNQIETYTTQGQRLIAVAFKEVPYDTIPDDTTEITKGLVFGGLLIFKDPVREGVEEAIAGVLSAGAQIRLVTGDNPQTALAVAQEAGIAGKHDIALTGDDIAAMSDEELLQALSMTKVFARVLPRQKMRLARILQAQGEIVAMTGDGINDAPALRKAHIGVAIGSGTEVAKESSDLVLMKDSFATIYAAIEEGRRIISNLRRIVGYLLATSLSEAVLIGGALLTGGAIPILPAQILWANIIEEGLMSVAFAFEAGDKNAMKQKPQDIHEEGVLSKDVMRFLGMVVFVLSALLCVLYAYLRMQDASIETIRSIMFLAISMDSLFIAFSFRSLTVPVWRIPLLSNLFFIAAFLISIVLLFVVLSIPFLREVFSYTPLSVGEIAITVLYGIVALIAIEIGKWIFFTRKVEK